MNSSFAEVSALSRESGCVEEKVERGAQERVRDLQRMELASGHTQWEIFFYD